MKKAIERIFFGSLIIMGIALMICNFLKICPEPPVAVTNIKEAMTAMLVVVIAFGPLTGMACIIFGFAGLTYDK